MSFLGKDVTKILIKIQKGDEWSKNILFEKTYNHLKRVAYLYVCNKNDIEDILMETYLKVNRYIQSFNSNEDGYNWMCKILQNVAYDWNKTYQREILIGDWNDSGKTVDFEEVIAVNDEMARWLRDYSERDRRMMYMRFWENHTIIEIAKTLGMGKSNVHKRIKKITEEILQKERNKVEK